MIHSTVWLIILLTALPYRCICDSKLDISEADGFFDYKLCDGDNKDALQWLCLVPGPCRHEPHASELHSTGKEMENCHAILAIQQQNIDYFPNYNSEPKIWRVVMQTQAKNGKVLIDKGIKFTYDGNNAIECELDNGKLSAKKIIPFTISNVKGFHNATMFMCEFIIDFGNGYNAKPGIKWNEDNAQTFVDSTGEQMQTAIGTGKKVKCQLKYLESLLPKTPELLVKDINRDRTPITCPTGYVMRRKKTYGEKEYTSIKHYECNTDNGLMEQPLVGNSNQMNSPVDIHCARKKCKECPDPTCTNSDKSKCPKIVKTEDFESCLKLKCDANLFKIGGQVHQGKPTCDLVSNEDDGGQPLKKWRLNGTDADKVECGDKVLCKDATAAVKMESESMKMMAMGKDEVTCKENRTMSYTSTEGKEVTLSKIVCNFKDGTWHEQVVGKPEIEPYKGEQLKCKGLDTGASVASAGALLYVGIGLGFVAVVCVVIFIVCYCMRRSKKKRESALKHKLATKSSKSKEGGKAAKAALQSKSSSSGPPEGRLESSNHSVTQKKSKSDGKDKPDVTTGTPAEKSNPKIADEAAKLRGGPDAKRKTAALLESSKMEQDDEQQPEGTTPRIDNALAKKGKKADAATPQYRITVKDPFVSPAPAETPRDVDGAQSQTDNGATDEAASGAQTPVNGAAADTPTDAGAAQQQQPADGDDDEAEQSMWPKQAGTPADNATPVAETPTNQEPAKPASNEEENAVVNEADNMKTGREKAKAKDDEKDRKVADMPTARVKDATSTPKSNKKVVTPKPPSATDEPEKKRKSGKRQYRDQPSDWESDKVSSRSSKKGDRGRAGRKVDEPSRKAGGHHGHGSNAGCGPLCMPMSPGPSKPEAEEN